MLFWSPVPNWASPPNRLQETPGTLTATLACQYLAPPANSNVATIANINAAISSGPNMWQANSANTQVVLAVKPHGDFNADFTHFDYGDFLHDCKDTT